jgi:hypothetical protein
LLSHFIYRNGTGNHHLYSASIVCTVTLLQVISLFSSSAMKNPLTALLPALALLALGGCAGTAALSSSEDDGVYYSSKDQTTAIVSAEPAPATADEAANPDYNGNAASSSSNQNNSGSDQYYDNTYTYMQGVPSYGPGLNYYTPYSPYTSLSYGSAWGGGGCGFSPYGICDPFYSPFNSPFGYGYGSGVSISLGFGRPWGYGGFGYGGYARPYYGYGYSQGFYDPFFYGGPIYSGYYGRGAYYGNSYYGRGFGGNGYGNRYSGNENGRNRASGPRRDRSAEGRYSAGGVVNTPNAPVTGGNSTGGRMRSEGRAMQGSPTMQPAAPGQNEGRARADGVTATPGLESTPVRTENGYNRPQRMSRTDQPVYRDMTQPTTVPTDGGQILNDNGRGRRRGGEVVTEGNPTQPQEGQRRRGGWLQNAVTQPQQPSNTGQAAEQPRRQRAYDQPRPAQRSYEQPAQRSYEQPQRASQPSYSAPSNSGGGNSGGGGGRGRGRAD